ncbi:MAG: hypothetical protein ETSY2_38795 [Candidatus Entotheonella gemina]|uniref:histidine kinase n=1 Tax=Candidatus Entotheonella gemina TaxID=1429439 RepID=W4LS47_9BACT|nr:MAG: hypothetical protein ETSY2_38795 [Candidatus Entotheonella gemina]
MSGPQATILVVDDELVMCKRLEALLTPRDYQVITAANGEEALRQVRQAHPDLILLDVMLSGLDGFEVCRRLKDDPDTRLIPIVIVTVLSDIEHRIRGLEAGADDFLTKPVHRDELLARIRTSLRMKRTIDHKVRTLRQHIQQVADDKALFLSAMSHDLRTQLDAIIGFSEVLQDQAVGRLNEAQEEYINYILMGSMQLLNLINGLIDMSKMETGEASLEQNVFALRPLLAESVSLVQGQAQTHHIRLSLDIAEDVDMAFGDERKVRQVLFNLLSQALKVTPDYGQVGMQARVDTARVFITVWDSGPNIDPEELEGLFEEFRIAQGFVMQTARAGLGLALTKRLVELHGETIVVDSHPEQGTRFTFSLPFAKPEIGVPLETNDGFCDRGMP